MAPLALSKKKKRSKLTVTYVEPLRKNLLDVMLENMALAKRNIYIHRLIYIGRHSFSPGELNNVSHYFHDIIDNLNSHYYDEHLSGFFLYYPRYFCHVIEGSELSLKKHLDVIFNKEEISQNIEKTKLLVAYHHINQRFLPHWTELTARPPTLLEKIDITSDLHSTMSRVVNCIQKLYKLGISLRAPIRKSSISEELNESQIFQQSQTLQASQTFQVFQTSQQSQVPQQSQTSQVSQSSPQQSQSPQMSQTTQHSRRFSKSLSRIKSTVSCFEDIGRPSDSLPEYNLLEFLLESPHTQELKEYADAFGKIPILKKYNDLAWPAQADYVPWNVFDDEFDPITDLPSKEQEVDPDLI